MNCEIEFYWDLYDTTNYKEKGWLSQLSLTRKFVNKNIANKIL